MARLDQGRDVARKKTVQRRRRAVKRAAPRGNLRGGSPGGGLPSPSYSRPTPKKTTRPAPVRQPGPYSAEERQTVSQHKRAVRRQGRRPAPGGTTTFTDAQRRKVERFKDTAPSYKKSIQEAYASQPVAVRRRRVARANRRIQQGAGTQADRIVTQFHGRRKESDARTMARQQITDRQRTIVEDYKRRNPVRSTRHPLKAKVKSGLDLTPSGKIQSKMAKGLRQGLSASPLALAAAPTQAPKSVRRELSGQGKIAQAGEDVGKFVTSKKVQKYIKPIREAAEKQTPGVKAATAGVGIDEKTILRGAKDVITMGAQAPASWYVPIAAGVDLAKGKTGKTEQLVKDLDKSSAAYNVGAATVELAKGNPTGAGRRLQRAKVLAEAHPGYAAAEAVGVKGAIGRGAGATSRQGGRAVEAVGRKTKVRPVEKTGKAIRKVGAVHTRPDRREPGTNLVEKREWSPDLITKGVQKSVESSRIHRSNVLRQRAYKAEEDGDIDKAQQLHERAQQKDPRELPRKEIERQMDEHSAAWALIKRRNRAEVTERAQRIVKGKTKKIQRKQPKFGGAVNIVTQRIARADPEDMKRYRDEIVSEFDNLDPAGKAANRRLVRQIDIALEGAGRGRRKTDWARVEKAARDYAQFSGEFRGKLAKRGLRDPEEMERRAVMPFAIRNMKGVKHDPEVGLYREAKDGTKIKVSTAEIKAEMDRRGIKSAGYISQAPDFGGSKVFYTSGQRPVQMSTKRFTGKATQQGTFRADEETLIEQPAQHQSIIDATDEFTEGINLAAVRGNPAKGEPSRPITKATKQDAEDAIATARLDSQGRPLPNQNKLVAVRANPFAGKERQLQSLLDEVEDPEIVDRKLSEMVDSALKGDDGPGPWVLIPEAAQERLMAHNRRVGATGMLAQRVGSTWKQTILTTSPKWLISNPAEATVRATVAQAGPRSWITMRNVIKTMRKTDPEAAKRLEANVLSGGLMGNAQPPFRRADQVRGNARVKNVMARYDRFMERPAPRTLGNAARAYTHFIRETVNGTMERNFQMAMAGKELRRSELMTGEMVKLWGKSVEQAARGLKGTSEQIKLGREVDIMFGKYGKWSPDMRAAMSFYTPFIPWSINAARFLFKTMPADHPVLTGLTASFTSATEEWRNEFGLNQFIENAVPGWLQGSIPGKDAKWRGPAQMSPAGFAAGLPENIPSLVLPQLSGAEAALARGENWKGQTLRDKDGTPVDPFGKAQAAFLETMKSFIPFYQLGRGLSEKGPKKYVEENIAGRTPNQPVTTDPAISEINRKMLKMRKDKTDRTKDRSRYSDEYYRLQQKKKAILAKSPIAKKKAAESKKLYPRVLEGNRPSGQGKSGGDFWSDDAPATDDTGGFWDDEKEPAAAGKSFWED